MIIQRIPLSKLEPNTGQFPGLPSNPREWTKSDIDRIAKSLAETPELFEARPIIAIPYNGKFVILGGNLRFEGAKKNKDKDAPVMVVPEDTPVDKLKEIVIKDNGQFGEWDYDSLANEWSDLDLTGWGVPRVPETGESLDLDDFQTKFDEVTNKNCIYPIVPEFDEESEVFIIVSRRKTDSNWLRERLGMQKMKSYKSDEVAKSNVISIEDLQNVL